ncbi:MAG: AAA family ATPase [Rhodocyclaceae bacterium]|nr:AAA family ATPase [Rhodocyclaceae bacterium]
MKLQIEKAGVEALVARFPELSGLREQLRLGPRVEVACAALNRPQLGFLRERYAAGGPSMAGRAAQLQALEEAIDVGGHRYAEGELERLAPDLMDLLLKDPIRGWLFRASLAGKPAAYVVTRLDFTPPSDEESGRVVMELRANAMGKVAIEQVLIRGRDLPGRTLREILAEKGYLKENPGLIEAYDAAAAHYFDWRARTGMQFSARGSAIFADDPSASHRTTDWTRKPLVVLSTSGGDARLVNDEGVLRDRDATLEVPGDILARFLRKAGKSLRFDLALESRMEDLRDQTPAGLFTQIPVHPFVLMFHLDLHHHLWVHVADMQPYVYDATLKDRLVLPASHTDLIDILTAEMDVLMDDIVAGKSGGTTVLCAGPPGVGKTLTAEVYAEIIQRPLYRIHSGQLGLSVAEMEAALREALTRGQRWGAVMLIDEADVYIRRRDDDMAANAVVGVFLRVLEYFNGLLFLTTNRIGDIDEAIVSRCIALIRYHPPGVEDRARIWRVMAAQFALTLDESLVHTLAERFADASGRDIKGLARLTAKYCRHKQLPVTLDAFLACAVFRGMDTTRESTP